MTRLARNSMAAGLTTLLLTTGLSFAANGATTTTAYAEAQFIAAQNGLGEIVNPLGDALEDSGSNACEPATAECPAEAFTQSPLEPLEDLTVPVGDGVTGSELGAAGNYATADAGASRAASGAVTSDGIVQAGGGNGAADADATLDLSGGALGELGVTDALTNLSLQIGAISSSIELASPTADPVRDYSIAGADMVLSVPALSEFAAAVDTAGSADLDDVDISVDTMCSALGGGLNVGVDSLGLDAVTETLLETLTLVDGEGNIDLCDNEVVTALGGAGVIEAKITGLNAATDGLTTFTNDDGVVFDFANGEIRFDVAAVLLNLGTDINDLPENTDLLAEVLPALVLNVDDLLDNLNDNLVEDVKNNFDVELSVLGTAVPLEPLTDGAREQLLPAIQTGLDGLSDVFAEVGDPLAEALTTITDGLADVLQILVNVPDAYTTLRSDEAPTTGDAFSQTALRITLLGGEGGDILLANTLAGPNTATEVADDNANADTNADTVTDADADTVSDADTVAGTDTDGSTTGSIADADSAADADASANLPDAGAPNLLPFFLLGIALLAFGSAVLLNERRRLGAAGPDAVI